MALDKLDAPGFLDDFTAAQRTAWSAFISDSLDDAARGNPEQLEFDGPREQFYNPLKFDAGADLQKADISWIAFPRNVTVSSVSDKQRWRLADSSRDLQDEYCEWSVERDPDTDKIKRVTFTCEGPEYWEFLANSSPNKVVSLYREFVSSEVKQSDLFFSSGRYNPRNKWNVSTSKGAMHLIQAANTLTAEIELAGGSSVVRMRDGQLLMDEQELIRCGQYGDANRHSDPHIGAQVNGLARQKAFISLDNPIGLYFAGLSTAGWATPDGSDPASYWRYVRGSAEKPVRAVYEVPKDRPFAVGDIQIGGRAIDFAAQIADFISMKLTGVATQFGQSTAKPMKGCRRRIPQDVAAEALPLSVRDLIRKEPIGSRRA